MKVLCALLVIVFVVGCTNTAQIVQPDRASIEDPEAFIDREDEKAAQIEPPSPPTPHDLCLGVSCPPSTATCPDGAQVVCQNSCTNGVCSVCVPNCLDHQDLCSG